MHSRPERERLIKTEAERQEDPGSPPSRLSRRIFLWGSGATMATGVGVVAGLQVSPAQDLAQVTPAPATDNAVPAPPATPPEARLAFFRPDEAELVEAIAARIIPGNADDPGAREAGVVYFIDGLLAQGSTFPEPTYRHPPFAMTYEGEEPPLIPVEGAPAFVWVQEDELERYGFQSPLTLREMYQQGLPALARYAESRFGGTFASLRDDEQDGILMAMEDGEAEGFDAPSGDAFFELLRTHAIEGMFSDPVYGGNRNLVGWSMVGYPGAQRGYSPREMQEEGTDRQPQGLTGLPHFHPGRPQQGPLLPVRGSEEQLDHD